MLLDEEPIEMAAGGGVSDEMLMVAEAPTGAAGDEALASVIGELMMSQGLAGDPSEAEFAEGMAESNALSDQAPLSDIASQLAQAGRGNDTVLAHLQPGEVVLPAETLSDSRFESEVESRFQDVDLDPEAYVVGAGIASINPETGLEEFGLGSEFKKARKFAKKAAKYLKYVPGDHQATASLLDKAFNVYDASQGRADPLVAIASLFGATGGGSAAQNFSDILAGRRHGTEGIEALLSGLGGDWAGTGSTLLEGLGNLFTDPSQLGDDLLETLRDVSFTGGAGSTSSGGSTSSAGSADAPMSEEEFADLFDKSHPDASPKERADSLEAYAQALSMAQLSSPSGAAVTTLPPPPNMSREEFDAHSERLRTVMNDPDATEAEKNAAVAAFSQAMPHGATQGGDNFLSRLGGWVSGSGSGQQQSWWQEFLDDQLGIDQHLGRRLGLGGGDEEGSLLSGLGGGLGGLGGLGGIASILGPAYLAKLAYDYAKEDKGIPQSVVSRFTQPQPSRPMPWLSGGRPTPDWDGGRVSAYGRDGGRVMAYAKGGDVSAEEFAEMDGGIDGEGTEISDDVPAMLSDGEFVMTGQSVRGAGAFDMNEGKGGIITLTPGGSESREEGTDLMYRMMELFSEFAEKPAEDAA